MSRRGQMPASLRPEVYPTTTYTIVRATPAKLHLSAAEVAAGAGFIARGMSYADARAALLVLRAFLAQFPALTGGVR